MHEPIVFFTRCRPQKCDAIDVALKNKIIFIGWSAWKPGQSYRRGHVRECIVDLAATEDEWQAVLSTLPTDHRRHASQNRNMVAAVGSGSIVLVPRPARGVIFAGRVKGEFELINDPLWADEYLDLRRAQGAAVQDEGDHICDVVQCWHVDKFRPIPFPAIPAWIRRSLFGRSTYGRIHAPGVMDLEPFSVLNELIEEPSHVVRPWTIDPGEVERRLVTDVAPSSFEHLCVALLQLEHADQVWAHVGGSGDGGVDGIGAGEDGRVTGLLQCKWKYGGEPVDFATPWGRSETDGRRRILASLLHAEKVPIPDGVQFWSRKEISRLVIKLAAHLPIATSMRVGARPT